MTRAAAPTGNPGLFLTYDQAASELATSPLNVLRLVARRQLATVPMGDAGKRRILPSELQRYVAGGFAGFLMPEIGGNGWYTHDDLRSADAFVAALTEAAAGQLPTDMNAVADKIAAQVERSNTNKGPRLAPTIELPITAPMREIIQRAVPVSALMKSPPSRFPDWRHVYVAQLVRDAAERSVRETIGAATAIHRLFDSPEDYDRHVGVAVERIMLRNAVVLSKPLPSRQVAHFPNFLYYTVPVRAIAPPDVVKRVRELAF